MNITDIPAYSELMQKSKEEIFDSLFAVIQQQQEDLRKAATALENSHELNLKQQATINEYQEHEPKREKAAEFLGLKAHKSIFLEVWWGKLNETDLKIIKVMNDNPEMTAKQIANHPDVYMSEETVEKVKQRIKKLPGLKGRSYQESAKFITQIMKV